jgi:glutamate-1-semialdehyde 2,1-aminomutase
MAYQSKQQVYDKLADAFTARNSQSKAVYDAATEALPGGNTRSVLFYHPYPLSIKTANGARLIDVDGHEYVDLLGEYTAGLYGHSEPVIIEAIQAAAKNGINFGSQHEDEVKLAAMVKQRFPSIDLIRFTNSGTEANLMAIAAAKAFTGKKKVLVFDGGYHGGAFLFKDGKSSAVNAPHQYLIASYNDLQSVKRLTQASENSNDVAAIVVEPMMGSAGAIPPIKGFLEGLREVATATGAVLIFDEVSFHSG